MSFAASTAVYPSEAFVRRTSVWSLLRTHIFLVNILSVCVVGILALVYIVEVNSSASKGYRIHELETQRAHLQLLHQQLEVSAREAQSLEHVARDVKMLGLVEAESPVYVVSGTPSVAMVR